VDGSARGGYFYLATSGALLLATRGYFLLTTRGDFFMAVDTHHAAELQLASKDNVGVENLKRSVRVSAERE